MLKSIKTAELTGAALDWAVAKSEGYTGTALESRTGEWYTPSCDWAQGGPIIEREHISIEATRVGGLGDRWMASVGDCVAFEDKPLIAAMRCYVSSKLGDIVEVPEELLK